MTTAALRPDSETAPGDRRPLRLLFVGHEATRTGAPIALLHLMRWVRDHLKWPIACVLQKGGELEDEYRALCPTVVADRGHWHDNSWRHRLLGRVGLPGIAPRLNSAPVRAKIAEADLIYVNTLDTAAILRHAEMGSKLVVSHVHELEYTIRSHVGAAEADEVLGRSQRVIACAQVVADNLISNHHVAPERVDVVHEYIVTKPPEPSARGLRDELQIAKETFVVGASGVMGWRKGTDLFLQVAKLVQERAGGREVCFAWLGGYRGSAEFEQFTHDARLLGVESTTLHVPGRGDPLTFFQGIDLFLLPSREDPYPLVCLEAASCGVPTVCFAEAGGMPEFVQDDAGLTVPYLDLPAMASAILRLRDDEALRRTMGAAARRKVQTRHDVATAAPKIVAAILKAWEAGR